MEQSIQVKSVKKRKKGFKYETGLLIPFLIILFGLILFPMLIIIFYSFVNISTDIPTYALTLDYYRLFLVNKLYLKTLGISLVFAFITTFGCILIGYPIAYFISKRKKSTQALLITLVTSPMWINMLLRVLAVKQIFEGPLLSVAKLMGYQGITLLGNGFVISFGMIYCYLPYMVLPIYTILSKLDVKLTEASLDLGAKASQTFKKVVLPLSIPGVLSGVAIVFLSSATTLVISKYLGEGKYVLIGDVIEYQFYQNEDWSFGGAISVILLILFLGLMWLFNRIDKTELKGADEE